MKEKLAGYYMTLVALLISNSLIGKNATVFFFCLIWIFNTAMAHYQEGEAAKVEADEREAKGLPRYRRSYRGTGWKGLWID